MFFFVVARRFDSPQDHPHILGNVPEKIFHFHWRYLLLPFLSGIKRALYFRHGRAKRDSAFLRASIVPTIYALLCCCAVFYTGMWMTGPTPGMTIILLYANPGTCRCRSPVWRHFRVKHLRRPLYGFSEAGSINSLHSSTAWAV